MNSSAWKTFRDYGITAAAAILIALAIRFYWVEAYRIPSLAMSPTLLPGDTIFVLKWPYSIHQSPAPDRGDIVVFAETSTSGSFNLEYIKRVIALPGDRVALKNGQVFLNQKPLSSNSTKDIDTETLPEGKTYPITLSAPLLDNIEEQTVPPNHVFVIGDFRCKNSSLQKISPEAKKRRGWGLIPIQAIKGKASFIWLSISPSSEGKKSELRFNRMFRRIE